MRTCLLNIIIVACIITVLIGCVDDEKSSLVSFDGSECKHKAYRDLDAKLSYNIKAVTPTNIKYEGLQCIRWDVETSRIDLINFSASCGIDWEPKAVVDDSGVTLSLVNPDCGRAECSCFYDWSFVITEFPKLSSITTTVKEIHCDAAGGTRGFSAELPIGENSSGILCRQADEEPLYNHAILSGLEGTLHMLCRSDVDDTLPDCDDGLICEEVKECSSLNPSCFNLCMAECSDDSDCPLPEVLSCQEGLCKLSNEL